MYSISMFDFPILFLIVVTLKWFVDAEVAAGVIGHPRNVIDEEHVEDQNSFLMQSLMRMLM